MRKTWLISDEHFFHENIIGICDRPFKNADEMNMAIINNHNKYVKNGQLVIHLGDFCFGNIENIKNVLSQLNGTHVLIKGNHDHKSNRQYLECGFSEVYSYPIILEGFYILSHKPVFLNKHTPYCNIHGHLHDTNMEMLDNDKNLFYNISVEQIGYKPIDFECIKEYYGG